MAHKNSISFSGYKVYNLKHDQDYGFFVKHTFFLSKRWSFWEIDCWFFLLEGPQVDANGVRKPLIKISYKSDVWSLGCILYNLAYGKMPFGDIKITWLKLQVMTLCECWDVSAHNFLGRHCLLKILFLKMLTYFTCSFLVT